MNRTIRLLVLITDSYTSKYEHGPGKAQNASSILWHLDLSLKTPDALISRINDQLVDFPAPDKCENTTGLLST